MDRAKPKSRAKSVKRIVAIIVVASVLLGGSATLASIDFSTTRVSHDKITIDAVQQGMLEVKVSGNGQLLPRNIEQVVAQATGRVAKKCVRAGDVVHVGQLLAELSNPQLLDSEEEARSAWEGAAAELRASEAELNTNVLNQEVMLTEAEFALKKAQLQLQADTKLIGQHIMAEIDYQRSQLTVGQLLQTRDIARNRLATIRDNVKLQLDVKRTRVNELARALDRARNQVANLQVLAGIDGIVQSFGIEVGQQLDQGSPIGRIAKPDDLYAEFKVPARDATDIRTGQSVLIDTHSGTVDGVVTRIDPTATDGVVIVDADLRGAIPAVARPQLSIEGIIVIDKVQGALFVGKPSYAKSNAPISMYKLDSGGHYANRVTIQSGKLSVNYMQVVQGLSAGDRVITSDVGEWQDKKRILID